MARLKILRRDWRTFPSTGSGPAVLRLHRAVARAPSPVISIHPQVSGALCLQVAVFRLFEPDELVGLLGANEGKMIAIGALKRGRIVKGNNDAPSVQHHYRPVSGVVRRITCDVAAQLWRIS